MTAGTTENRSPIRPSRHAEEFRRSAAAIDRLFRDALERDGRAAFKEFLQFAKRLSNLSIYNAMLVKVQRPGAVAVATEEQWGSMGGLVRRCAIPIVILQPFGPVRYLYERSDVSGVELRGEEESSLLASGNVDAGTYDRVVKSALKHRITVGESDGYGGLRAGTAEALAQLPGVLPASENGPLWHVTINGRHDLPTRFATLAHELGHIYCGHLGADPKGRWVQHRQESHAQCEMEAEAVCWLVCNRNGVSSRSADYLHDLIEENDLAQGSIFSIYTAANRIEPR
jgi:hypothetical protein